MFVCSVYVSSFKHVDPLKWVWYGTGGRFALRRCRSAVCEQSVNASYRDMIFCVSAVAGWLPAAVRIMFFRICSLLVTFRGTCYLIVHTSIKKEEKRVPPKRRKVATGPHCLTTYAMKSSHFSEGYHVFKVFRCIWLSCLLWSIIAMNISKLYTVHLLWIFVK